MPVQFKFRGEKAFRTLLNVTTPCTVQRVKNAIYEQARISDQTTDLALEDPITGAALAARVLLVPDSFVQLVVRRTPLQNRDAGTALALTAGPSDEFLDSERREEESAIDRIVEQHDVGDMTAAPSNTLIRYSRSYRLAVQNQHRQKEGYDLDGSDDDDVMKKEEPPPPNYTCHRCGVTGGKPESHWIWECPTNDDPDHMRKVRTAKGVPRQFLKKVSSIEEGQEQSAGGVTFTLPGHSGHYIIAHQNASYEEQKLRVGDTVQEKVTTAFSEGAKRVEESLKCPLCHQLFRQAVLAPCCGATFCSDCVVDRLHHSSIEHGRCPGCSQELLAHQLVVNKDIRNQVEQVSRSSKAAAVASQKISDSREKTKAFEVDLALKDRVNRPRKFAEEAASGSRPLALTDGSVAGAPAHALGASWQPLGFGAMLGVEQFAYWQQAARAGASSQIQEQFAAWQRKMREAAPPAPVVPALPAPPAAPAALPAVALAAGAAAPPSRESFEEWKRLLRKGKHASMLSPPGQPTPAVAEMAGGGALDVGAPLPKREKRMKVAQEDL